MLLVARSLLGRRSGTHWGTLGRRWSDACHDEPGQFNDSCGKGFQVHTTILLRRAAVARARRGDPTRPRPVLIRTFRSEVHPCEIRLTCRCARTEMAEPRMRNTSWSSSSTLSIRETVASASSSSMSHKMSPMTLWQCPPAALPPDQRAPLGVSNPPNRCAHLHLGRLHGDVANTQAR